MLAKSLMKQERPSNYWRDYAQNKLRHVIDRFHMRVTKTSMTFKLDGARHVVVARVHGEVDAVAIHASFSMYEAIEGAVHKIEEMIRRRMARVRRMQRRGGLAKLEAQNLEMAWAEAMAQPNPASLRGRRDLWM